MSKNNMKFRAQLNRRGFIRGIAATGAMATFAAGRPAAAAQSAGENKGAEKSWRDKPDPIDEVLISDSGTMTSLS